MANFIKEDFDLNHFAGDVLTYITGGGQPRICKLINSVHYFLDIALIIETHQSFYLYVAQGKILKTWEKYRTAKGAKIAFIKIWFYRGYKDNVMPEWSHLYLPEQEWVHQQLIDTVSVTTPLDLNCPTQESLNSG